MEQISQVHLTAELARRNPVDYTCLHNYTYEPVWFHWLIASCLQKVTTGAIKRLIITMPPRHGKSELCSKTFPPWYLGYRNGEQRSIIAASYAARLSHAFGRAGRNMARSPLYSEIFGEHLDRAQGTSKAEWALTNGNTYSAAGVGGGITGFGASVFLIDDPIKDRKQANSAVYREALKDWYKEVALTRLTPDGAMVIIMTRWHYDDLVGWLLTEPEWAGENFTVIKLPAIQTEHDLSDRLYDNRKPGEALWPERFSEEKLNDIAEGLGPMAFNCLYQQDPKVEGGQVLNINDLRRYKAEERPKKFMRTISSWDTAFESKSTSDYSVGSIWGDTGKNFYLLHVVRVRMRFPQLKKLMIATHKQWNEDAILIESKASGKDLIYELQEETDLPVQPVNPVVDKVSRAAAISGRVEAGRVFIPDRAPWLRIFLTELEHFPDVDHDDQVDSFTQAIRWMSRYGGSVLEVI